MSFGIDCLETNDPLSSWATGGQNNGFLPASSPVVASGSSLLLGGLRTGLTSEYSGAQRLLALRSRVMCQACFLPGLKVS